jgi:hypothetical protein
MEFEQMMAGMLAEMKARIRTNQANSETKAETNLEKMRAGQELMKEDLMAMLETKLDAHHERMTANVNAWQKR